MIICNQGEAEVDVGKISVYPTLVVRISSSATSSFDGEPSEVILYFEKRPLSTCPDVFTGLVALFSTYYMLNVAFPKPLTNTLNFLDIHVIGAEKSAKISASVQRKINMLHL